jgi:hypothetical protein
MRPHSRIDDDAYVGDEIQHDYGRSEQHDTHDGVIAIEYASTIA